MDKTPSLTKAEIGIEEEMIPASKTDCVTIDLSEFEPGTYTVGLKNQWDDCLWGEFYANYDKKWSYDQNCIGC